MGYGERKRTTLYLPKKLVEEAKLKAGKSASRTVEDLLIQYVSIDGSIDELEQFKKESERIIREEKKKIKQYEEEIQEKEKQIRLNTQDIMIMNDCIDSIDRKYRNDKVITLSFLKMLSKTRDVELTALNDIVLQKGYKVIHE